MARKEKFDLQSRIRWEGVFWDAVRPDEKVSGTLASDGKHIELTTRAELVTPTPAMFMGTDEAPAPDIMHGLTSQGHCTLIGLQQIDAPGLLNYATGEGVRWKNFRVTGACVTGWHLPSDTAEVLTATDLTYTGIGEWLPGSGASIHLGNEGTTIFVPKGRRSVMDVSVIANRLRVLIKIDPNLEFKLGGKNFKSDSEPIITFEPAEPKSLQWFVDAVHRFENLLSLCLGCSVRAQSMRLIGKSEDTESGWMIRPRGGKTQKPYLPIWVVGDSSQLATAVAAWFSTPKEFISLENLVYGTIRHSSLFVETEFLSLAQAIESFHRFTDKLTVVAPSLFEQMREKLCQFISENWADSPIAERFVESIQFANEPKFQTRIQSLLARIDPNRLRKLIGDPVEFERTLRQTRNYFTHPGTKKKGSVLTQPRELFLFNQKLHVVLRLLMLKSIGFPEEAVFDQVFQQSRRYS